MKIAAIFNTPWMDAPEVLQHAVSHEEDGGFDGDYTTLHTLARVSATDYSALVFLGFDNAHRRFVVIKDYSFEGKNYLLPLIVRRQIETYYVLRKHDSPKGLQKCLGLQITKSKARFVFKYYPMLFSQMFKEMTPKHVLLEKAVELVKSVVYLHDKLKIVHRDIKSSNCCLSKSGRMVLIDFDTSVAGGTNICSTLPVCTFSTAPPEFFRLEHERNVKVAEAELPEDKQNVMDSKQFCYDGFAADFWSAACVVSELFLGHELFTFHAGQDLMVHYERLCLFSRNMQNGAAEGGGTSTSQHPLVKILKRRVPKEYAEFVWPLLRGSFSLDPSDRRSAINTFLDDPKIRNLVK